MGTPSKSLTEKEEEIKEEYLKTLQDLTFNSKPLIDVLTEVAEENKEYAQTIADCIVEQLEKVDDPLKLPILYLIDSIIKRIGQHYMYLFCRSIDRLFTKVYEKGDENTRGRLLKLRYTWNGIIPLKVLSSLDKMVQAVNPSWPSAPAVHVNPKFVSISTHVPASNGNATTTTHTPQQPPAFRIAPVSSQLINAAKRVRDPRLRRIELQQIRPPNNNTSVTKEAKTSTSSQIDAKIDQKNDRRQPTKTKPIVAPKSEPKIKAVVPKTDSKEAKKGEEKSTKSRSNEDTKKKNNDSKSKQERSTNVCRMLNKWVTQGETEPTVGNRKWSKEEREKGLKTIAKALIQDRDADKVIDNLSEKHPKIAQKLIRLMKELRNETSDKKPSPKKLMPSAAPKTISKMTSKRDKNASPKPASRSPTPSVAVTTIAETKPISGLSTVKAVSMTESSLTPAVSSSIPATTVTVPMSVPVTMPVTVAIPVVTPTVVTTTQAPVISSITTTISSPNPAVAAPVVSPASLPSPVLPIPPPAPIISSTAAAAAEQKSQDIDYRQIFGFGLLNVPPVVTEEEPKIKEKPIVDEIEIIDIDALPSKPKKRKIDDRKHHRDRKRKRNDSVSSNESLSSDNDAEKVNHKRSISEVLKISEDEDSKGFDDVKKIKSDDSFYSQLAPKEVKKQSSDLIIMSVSETARAKSNSPPMFPKLDSNFGANFSSVDFTSSQMTPEIPPTDMKIVEMIDDDPVRSINIDGVSREIRHYGSTAIVFMNWDDPREISFFNGVRNVIIDDKFGIPCSLNAPEVETLVYGKKHRFRLGVPTRELYVNGVGYECYFGGPPIKIRLDYKTNYIKLEGPPPSVNIGKVKRIDTVAGKINIIINDQHKFPIFLDAKPQYFKIDGKPVVIMFIDGLKRVLINNVLFTTDFGGPSQSFKIMNKVYYFRFTVLPLGITPGINLSQMLVTKLPSPPPLPPQFQYSVSDAIPTPPLPPVQLASAIAAPAIDVDPPVTNMATAPAPNNILENISIDELFQKLVASGIVPNIEKSEEGDVVKTVDLDRAETLKQKQPVMVKMLYSGIQCGSCGLRFPAEQTLKYSQHLDWHFRLNRKGKDGARTIHSRKWYYGKNDWIQFQEMEDTSDRGTSWFDNHPVTEYTEEVLEDVPCIPAGSNQNAVCELCRDRFEQFYNDESDEWQLRNAICVDNLIYHPICYKDHQEKTEQEKIEETTEINECAPEEPVEEITADEKPEPNVSTNYEYDSDIEDIEVIEPSIEEIVIPDDGNDFDEPNLETLNTEDIIAAQQEIIEDPEPVHVPIPIKVEPDRVIDFSDTGGEGEIESFLEEPESVEHSPCTRSGHEGVVTMDGNIELIDTPAPVPSSATKIKINISKNINEDKANSPRHEEPKETDYVVESAKETSDALSTSLAAGDAEKLVPVNLKSRVRDARLTAYPPVTKGTEKSGLCSIM